ncbi:MAG: GGDEF domain-containing protein, partial [Massilia sp.]|nr:GGDEF domain-containing protein [Massilia sp.]
DRLHHAMATSKRSTRHGALLFIDLDNFKTINDTLGHGTGDCLLQQVAERLTGCVRAGDTVARQGGDEFVILLGELSAVLEDAVTHTELIGKKILDALNQPYLFADHVCHSSASIGAAVFNGASGSTDEQLKRADHAMYRAKAAGRNAFRLFDAG